MKLIKAVKWAKQSVGSATVRRIVILLNVDIIV